MCNLFRILSLLLLVGVLSACTTPSGLPSGATFNAYTLEPVDGVATYNVTCYGLFEDSSACTRAAQNICDEQPVRPLINTVTQDDLRTQDNTDRSIIFQCGPLPAQIPVASSQSESVAPAAPPPPPSVRRATSVVNFAVGDAALSRSAETKLGDLGNSERGQTFSRARIDGYTDSTGSAALNRRLSEARARTAADYLVMHGIAAQKTEVRGHGAADPVATNKTVQGRAQNRRVEIELQP